MRIGLVVYGTIDRISGGYLYDRRLRDYLRTQGDEVEVISPAGYIRRLRAPWDILLQDELCHPSLLAANRPRRRYPVVSIVHHLRGSERPCGACGWAERLYLRSVDAFICNSRTTALSVEKALGYKPLSLIAYPGKDSLPQVSGNTVKAGFRGLRIIFVGNVIRRKCLHLLIDALALPGLDDCCLDVVGDLCTDKRYSAGLRARVSRQGLEGRVRFRGRLDDEEKDGLMTDSDVLAVPSVYEGLGICYLEAMGRGLAVIAGRNGGAGEIITDGKEGFLVSADSREIASRLRLLADEPGLLAAMRKRALERFRETPGWEDSFKRVREFLLTLRGTFL